MPLLIVFLFGVGAVGFGLWLFRAMVARAPDTVELKLLDVQPKDEVEELVFAFERLGYVRCGTYSASDQQGLQVHGLTHPSGRDAAIFDSPKIDVACELVMWSGEDNVTLSSAAAVAIPTPPWRTLHNMEGATPEALHAASLELEPEPLDALEPHTFPSRYMAEHARSMAWLKANV